VTTNLDPLLTALPHNVVVIGDKGFAGKDFAREMTEQKAPSCAPTGATRPAGTATSPRSANASNPSSAQPSHNYRWNATADELPAGVMARVAQRILALAAAIWHNWATDTPVKRSLIPLRPVKIQESIV
jgi:hypothetical protein